MEFIRIQQEFKLLSGISEEECMKYYGLLTASMREVERKRKLGISDETADDVLVQLTAAIAYYRYLLLRDSSGETVRVLDVSIQKDSGKDLERAERLKEELSLLAREFLKDEHFIFEAV